MQAGEDDAACPTVWVMPGTYVENVSIDRALVLEGVLLGDVVLDGDAGSVVTILSGVVTLRGLVVTNGRANLGGGIRNKGTLTLEGTRVEQNVATGPLTGGGGIHSTGPVTLTGTVVRENTLLGVDQYMDGAGVYVTATTLIVTGGSSISANTASFSGAGPSYCTGRGGGVFANKSSVFVDGGSSISANTLSLADVAGENGAAYASRASRRRRALIHRARSRRMTRLASRARSPSPSPRRSAMPRPMIAWSARASKAPPLTTRNHDLK